MDLIEETKGLRACLVSAMVRVGFFIISQCIDMYIFFYFFFILQRLKRLMNFTNGSPAQTMKLIKMGLGNHTTNHEVDKDGFG
jgi:hypothetical protein